MPCHFERPLTHKSTFLVGENTSLPIVESRCLPHPQTGHCSGTWRRTDAKSLIDNDTGVRTTVKQIDQSRQLRVLTPSVKFET